MHLTLFYVYTDGKVKYHFKCSHIKYCINTFILIIYLSKKLLYIEMKKRIFSHIVWFKFWNIWKIIQIYKLILSLTLNLILFLIYWLKCNKNLLNYLILEIILNSSFNFGFSNTKNTFDFLSCSLINNAKIFLNLNKIMRSNIKLFF